MVASRRRPSHHLGWYDDEAVGVPGIRASSSFNTTTICDSVTRDFFLGDAFRKGSRKVYSMLSTR